MSEKKTRIYKSNSRENFTIINNEILRRKDVSWKAKGILAYIMQLPADWEIYLEELQNHATDGRDSFRSGWKELQDAGYIRRYPVREQGKIVEWRTEVRETIDTTAFSPQTGFPHMEKPLMGNPLMENPKLLSTYSTKDLSISNTNKTNKSDSKLSESVLKNNFDLIWKDYPNKKGKAKSFAAYKKAIKDGVTQEAIHKGVTSYAQEVKRKRTKTEYIAHGSTWFGNRRWEDDYDIGKQYTNQNTVAVIPDTDELPF